MPLSKETLDRLTHWVELGRKTSIHPVIQPDDLEQLITAARQLESVTTERNNLLLNQRELLDTIDAIKVQLECVKSELAELRAWQIKSMPILCEYKQNNPRFISIRDGSVNDPYGVNALVTEYDAAKKEGK